MNFAVMISFFANSRTIQRDALATCGSQVNPVHSHVAFEKKYKDKTVTWTGKVSHWSNALNISEALIAKLR